MKFEYVLYSKNGDFDHCNFPSLMYLSFTAYTFKKRSLITQKQTQMETKKAVGIWIRVSTDMQEDSPEHHQIRGEHYAQIKGWEVVRIYRLEAVSGKSVTGRPEWKQMMEDVRNGIITGLIFSKLARVARNVRELLDFADYFRDHNADIISLGESFDTSSPAGRLFYTMAAAMAQWEREETSARVAASVPDRAALDKPLGGAASFGYRWEGKKFVVDKSEAPVRKLMYELFLQYKRKKAVASELNKRGFRTRNGSLFSGTTIDRLLRDPSAKGQRIANYTKSLGEGKKWIIKPKEDWVVRPCEPIVSESLWNECNQILTSQEQKRQKPGPRAIHLLSGFVTCNCGKKMYVFHESAGKYVCKDCKNRIAIVDLDEIYLDQLKTFLLTNTDAVTYRRESESILEQRETLLLETRTKYQKLYKRMSELMNLRLDGELSKEVFLKEHKPLEEQYLQLENQLPELEAEVGFLRIQSLSSETVLEEAKNLYDRWPILSFEEKRTIVEVITEKVTVGKNDIHIALAYSPAPSNLSSLQNSGKRERNLRDS
jgi:site-specific DNA recombinase